MLDLDDETGSQPRERTPVLARRRQGDVGNPRVGPGKRDMSPPSRRTRQIAVSSWDTSSAANIPIGFFLLRLQRSAGATDPFCNGASRRWGAAIMLSGSA